MNPISAFFLGLGTVTGIALATLFFVRGPLFRLLVELCGTEDRARFWQHLYEAALLLTVVFCALLFPPGDGEIIGFYDFIGMFRAAVFGILAILGVLAVVASVSIGRFESRATGMKAGTRDA